MSKLSIALTAVLMAGTATVGLAQQADANATAQTPPASASVAAPAPQADASATAQAQSGPARTQISGSVDTWIEGTVLSLDADGQKFSVRGVKLPFATAEAGMMKEIAEKTKNLDAAQRDAKVAEIRKEWQEKLDKAKQEQIATNPSDFNFSLPDKAQMVILEDQQILRQGDASMQKIEAQASASSSSSASAATAKTDTQAPQSSVDATAAQKASGQADAAKSDALDAKESLALRTLKDLKVGAKVKVGFDAGLLYNTAYVIVSDPATAAN
jgi:hypothetical protein